MRRMEHKLSVGDTLRRAFSIYRDQAGVLLPVAFWLFLGVAVLEVLLEDSLALLTVALLTLVVAFLYQGMVVGLVRDVQDGRRDATVRELISSVVPVLMPLIGAGLLTAIGIFFGFLLLVVPGFYLLAVWAVTAPVVVIERRGVFDALGRSRQLVRGNGWPVLGVFLVAIVIGLVVGLLLAALAEDLAEGEILEIVLYALASTVTAPIEALVASVLYFRLADIERLRSPAEPAATDLPPPAPGRSGGSALE
jgi:hypothetical protein